MKSLLPESRELYNVIFSDKQKLQIQGILNEINTNLDNYSTKSLWEMDKEIGGIGGYCMPCDPIKNPFPGGEYRTLFRPLQYARSEIDITGVYLHSKYVILNSGLHLEAVVRLALRKYKFLGRIRYMNSTLGNATKSLSKVEDIPTELINHLFKFVKIYNKSKHEVNQNEGRKRLFMPSDAIVGYLAARIIGYRLLQLIEHDSVRVEYRIDESKFNGLF
ncbi:MAG: hypothetical protein N4A48_09445 [Tepidibacter sp.]|uniref:hypothetical protein n=1 Tax=Tepidibacter sp. TaxID=2529387 RepID=UPI0025EA7066|nr:hypothetical protein [Tepidibacter sp.]MCT4508968.1 hypothetical protein [Tepidibacter sp.]